MLVPLSNLLRCNHTQEHTIWIVLTEEATRASFNSLMKSGWIVACFTVRHSTSSRCPLLRPGWSPPARQSGWVWVRRTPQRATKWDRRKLASNSFQWIYLDKTESDVFVKLLAVLWTVERRDRDCCQTLHKKKKNAVVKRSKNQKQDILNIKICQNEMSHKNTNKTTTPVWPILN